jgi:hypothetical protein
MIDESARREANPMAVGAAASLWGTVPDLRELVKTWLIEPHCTKWLVAA